MVNEPVKDFVNRPSFTLAHVITTAAMALSGLVYVNAADTDNKVDITAISTRQEQIMKQQDKIQSDFNSYKREQRVIDQKQLELLNQIKGKLED